MPNLLRRGRDWSSGPRLSTFCGKAASIYFAVAVHCLPTSSFTPAWTSVISSSEPPETLTRSLRGSCASRLDLSACILKSPHYLGVRSSFADGTTRLSLAVHHAAMVVQQDSDIDWTLGWPSTPGFFSGMYCPRHTIAKEWIFLRPLTCPAPAIPAPTRVRTSRTPDVDLYAVYYAKALPIDGVMPMRR